MNKNLQQIQQETLVEPNLHNSGKYMTFMILHQIHSWTHVSR